MESDASKELPWRDWLWVGVAFLVLYHICYWTRPGVLESEDFIKFYQPNLHFLIASLWQGEIPWWNPYIGLGRPFVSDIQNAVFYPPTYLFAFGMKVGLYLILSLHLLAALVGMRFLVRSLGVNGVIAWLAGFVLVFSGPFASLLFRGMIYYVLGLCYLPWLLWVVLRLTGEWNTKRVVAFGVMLGGQFLTGHPQTFWIGLVGMGLFVLIWKLIEDRSARGVGMPMAQMTAGIALAAGLTAVAWVPFLDLVAEGNRSGATMEQAGFGASRLLYLFSLFRVPPYQLLVNSAGNWFIGAVWTVAGVAGWITIRDARVRALMAVGLFALVFSFGTKTFLYGLCFDLLPGTSMFRFPIRMCLWLPLALLIAGAVFLGRKEWNVKERRVAGGVLLALLLIPFFGEGGPQSWQAIVFLLGGGAVAFFRSRLSWGLVVVMAVELISTNSFYRRGYSMEGRYGIAPTFEATGQIRQLLATRPPELPPARACLPPIMVPRNFGMMFGYANFDAYTSLFLKRPWDALHAAVGADARNVLNTTLNDQIYQHGPFGIPEVSIDFGVGPQQRRFVINPNPFPRAYLLTSTGRIPLRINEFTTSELRLGFTAAEPGKVVLNEAWFPGWRATVNGEETEVLPEQQWMRAVAVRAGKQEVVLDFKPRNIGLAAMLSFVGAVIVIVCFRKEFLSRRDREHPSGESPGPGSDT